MCLLEDRKLFEAERKVLTDKNVQLLTEKSEFEKEKNVSTRGKKKVQSKKKSLLD